MSVRKIVQYGTPSLREPSKEVHKVSAKIKTLIKDMLDTMYEANGVGLAAPQVGVLRRIVVIDVMDGNPLCLVNPEIVETSGEQRGLEGCLSLPGLEGEVSRPAHVVCKALDRNMQPITVKGDGLLARCICHELDHLDGVLYRDKADGDLFKVEPVVDGEKEE